MSAARRVARQVPVINRAWCKSCGICVAFCPKEALTLDEQGELTLDWGKCNGCGICELYCPDFAINLREEGVNGAESEAPADAG